MGSPKEEPERCPDELEHEVLLTEGFWIGIHPVTQSQWHAVMDCNPSKFPGNDHPVENVTWKDAVRFCKTLQNQSELPIRLPTEAEWEYAARGGTRTPFYWGRELNGVQANCYGKYPYGTEKSGPYLARTTPVGQYSKDFPHPWGLTDVIGNVWEWCADWYAESYYGLCPKSDPRGPDTGTSRVIRGGAWYNDPCVCRVSYRGRRTPDFAFDYYGFRLALGATDAPEQSGERKPSQDSV